MVILLSIMRWGNGTKPKKSTAYMEGDGNVGANPKTTAFLKECLADALIQLLETRPIEKITVPEIAAAAGVGRTTYFRNFASKAELLSYKLVVLWERWAEEHGVMIRKRYSPDNALTFFQFNYSIRPLLALMYRRGLQSALYDSFQSYMTPQEGATPPDCYRIGFYSYGLFGLLDAWIRRDFSESPEQMVGFVKDF